MIGKTGGFEDFEIATNPSEVTSVSGQVVLHASCTPESYTRMYNQLIICETSFFGKIHVVLGLGNSKEPIAQATRPCLSQGKAQHDYMLGTKTCPEAEF